jgi:hypothetical protein
MTALAFLAAIAILAVLAVAVAQARERARYLTRLHDEHNREREQWIRERQLLLNRIKPETAQYIPAEGPVVQPKAIGMDQDDDYWTEIAGMSAEDLAQAMMQQELAGLTE